MAKVGANSQRLLNTFVSAARIWAPSGKEAPMADEVVRTFQDMAIPGSTITVDDTAQQTGSNSGNVIVNIPASPDAPLDAKAIGLFFHLDRVPVPEGGPPGSQVEIEVLPDGTIRSKDSKSNIAADDICGYAQIAEAVRVIQEHCIPHGMIRVIGFVQEETDMAGARELDQRYVKDLDYGVDVDKGEVGEIMRGGVTIREWTVGFKGQSAHAGACPGKGKSAAFAAAKAFVDIGEPREISETQTINAAHIEGGGRGADGSPIMNAVPDQSEISVEYRGLTHGDLEYLQDLVEGAFENACNGSGVTWRTLKFSEYQGFNNEPNSPVVQFAEEAVRSAGIRPSTTVTRCGLEASCLNAKGLPTVGIGNGGHEAHTPQEYTTLKELVRGTNVILALIAQTAKPAQAYTTHGSQALAEVPSLQYHT